MRVKTYLNLFILCTIITFSSCDPKKTIEEKVGEAITEKVLESAGVEAENITEGERKSSIKIMFDGTELASSQDAFSSIQLTKELTALTLRDNEGTFNILGGLSLAPQKFKSAPLEINLVQGSNPDKKDTFMFTITANGQIYVMKEGVAKVEEFSKGKFKLSATGKGGLNTGATHNGEGLKSMTVEIECENPPYIFMGVKKEEVL